MNTNPESHDSRAAHHNSEANQIPPQRRPTTDPRDQPPPPQPAASPRPAQLDPRAVKRVIDTAVTWEILAERPWCVALLIALDDGPTTRAAAYTAAAAWAQGQLPDMDLSLPMAELVDARLAVDLGGKDGEALFALTTSGAQLLDRFAQATAEWDLRHQLAYFAETCILYGRVLQLTPTETQVLALIVDGRTDRQIAAALPMNHRTVEAHVRRVLRKMGMRRNALIARFTIASIEL